MNMVYKIGDFAGYVDLAQTRGPIETPMPERWYVLQTFPGKEAKVMRRFRDRGISAYHPLVRKLQMVRGRKIDRSVPLFANADLHSGFPGAHRRRVRRWRRSLSQVR
jgi:hypothetical protein